MRLSVAEPENKFLNTSLLLLSYERYHNSNSFGNLGMAIITLRVSAGIQGTRATFQWLRHFKNIFCSRLHHGNKTFKMTAKEKAKELIHYYIKELLSAKYSINGFVINDLAKQCAIIAVEEIINSIDAEEHVILYIYWQMVKQEIENL
jgi:hypothetical protein